MIGWLIIACEIGFWLLIAAGLVARYILKKQKASLVLFICTPLADLVLLLATIADLRNGAVASTVHGLAAVYIGVSVVYGHRMIRWADRQFAYRFANGEKPLKLKKYGAAHAKEERLGWYQHALAWLIGCAILAAIILLIDGAHVLVKVIAEAFGQTEPAGTDAPATLALAGTMLTWSFVLAIDFVISFSYTLFPRKQPKIMNH